MLGHEETLELIQKAQQGDENAKTMLLEHNMPLIKSIIKRYKGRQIEYDDLIQLGSLGLIKAVNNFNTDFNVRFSTYAVPMIAGEIKRFIRDDGSIKVSRAMKSQAGKINAFIDEYKAKYSKEPPVELIAETFDMDAQEVVFTMDSSKFPLSLYEKYDDENGQSLMDRIVSQDDQEDMLDKMMIKDSIDMLNDREKKIIILRYFRDKTQSEIAQILGVSQVQVSRLESKIIEKIKKAIT